MSDGQRPDQSDLTPSGNRGLTTRSSALVRRGLEALLSQQFCVVHFPQDRSMGRLYIRNHGSFRWDWQELGEACGDIKIPIGKELRLDASDTTSTDLFPLSSIKPDDLQRLYLWKTRVTDAELVHLQGLSGLQVLGLSDTQVSDAGLVHLQGLAALRELWLSHTQIGDTGLECLQGLTTLVHLSLSGTQISNAGLVHLQWLAALVVLDLSDTQIGDAGLIHLQGLGRLWELNLKETQVSEDGVAGLQHLLPNCHIYWEEEPEEAL